MKRKDGSWTNGSSKEGEKKQRGRESATGQSRKEWSISKVLAKEREGGIVGSGLDGLLFSPVMPVRGTWRAFFPFIRASGVECKRQPWPPACTLNSVETSRATT